jgi:type VI protein secretion system component VasF
MTRDIRDLFRAAYADENPPPIGSLVENVMAGAQRRRQRVNTVWLVLAGVVVAVLLVLF